MARAAEIRGSGILGDQFPCGQRALGGADAGRGLDMVNRDQKGGLVVIAVYGGHRRQPELFGIVRSHREADQTAQVRPSDSRVPQRQIRRRKSGRPRFRVRGHRCRQSVFRREDPRAPVQSLKNPWQKSFLLLGRTVSVTEFAKPLLADPALCARVALLCEGEGAQHIFAEQVGLEV